MVTVEIPTRLTVDDLVKAANQLPNQELNDFVKRIIALQSQRNFSLSSLSEQKLLKAINDPVLSNEERQRLNFLRAKSEAGDLTGAEHAELLQFVQRTERHDLTRLQALVQLAQNRGQTLSTLMQELDLEVRNG